MGLYDELRERDRQAATGDVNFLKSMMYLFELQVPESVAQSPTQTSFLTPLVIPPENYSMSEPFAIEVTPTMGSGLYVEENGILMRSIRLAGSTGWKPRAALGSGSGALATLAPSKRSWSRMLPSVIADRLSGHRHFQYLQDSVFRVYGDLKKDPSTSKDTRLFFHNPREMESWEVKPRQFDMERRRTLYYYSIDLLAIAKAKPATMPLQSEDKPVLTILKDQMRAVVAAMGLLSGGIRDLSAIQGAVKGVITNVSTMIDSVTEIYSAANDFVEGTTTVVRAPLASVESMLELVDEAELLLYHGTQAELRGLMVLSDLQRGYLNAALSNLGYGGSLLLNHPSIFEESEAEVLRKAQSYQYPLTDLTPEAIALIKAMAAPTSLSGIEQLGTSMSSGEAISAESAPRVQAPLAGYTGAREYKVGQGDTLVNLAAAFLGDARLWPDLAILNNLRPPYLSDQAAIPAARRGENGIMDSALWIGQKILIPNYSRPPKSLENLPVLGVTRDEAAEVQLLGRDIKLERLADGQWDVPVKTENGGLDVRTVAGVDNLVQMAWSIFSIERGRDPMYLSVGVRRIVGIGLGPADDEILKFRLAEALENDTRIAAVRKIDLQSSADQVTAEITAEVRGFTTDLRIVTPV